MSYGHLIPDNTTLLGKMVKTIHYSKRNYS